MSFFSFIPTDKFEFIPTNKITTMMPIDELFKKPDAPQYQPSMILSNDFVKHQMQPSTPNILQATPITIPVDVQINTAPTPQPMPQPITINNTLSRLPDNNYFTENKYTTENKYYSTTNNYTQILDTKAISSLSDKVSEIDKNNRTQLTTLNNSLTSQSRQLSELDKSNQQRTTALIDTQLLQTQAINNLQKQQQDNTYAFNTINDNLKQNNINIRTSLDTINKDINEFQQKSLKLVEQNQILKNQLQYSNNNQGYQKIGIIEKNNSSSLNPLIFLPLLLLM